MEKAYFNNIRSEIIPLLNNAKSEVLIAMAWFTSCELFEALLSCKNRGVHVDLILLNSPINFMDCAPDFNQLVSPQNSLWIAEQDVGIMHHKFCVIDNKLVITGSYNWTYRAETYNIENVLVTDSPAIVRSYKQEFEQLASSLKLASSSPRLTWNEIQQREDVDFREINYEIEHICKARNLPVMHVIKTNTIAQVEETRRVPYAKYVIGILALDDNGNEFLDPFINYRTRLPYHSSEKEFFFDSKNEKEFHCKFIFETPNDNRECQLINEVDLMQIAKGTCELDLPIKLSMSLDENGSLEVDIACSKTGQKITIPLGSNFVKYE